MRRDEGFTLIELLIVIVILGILGGIVAFAVSDRSGGGGYENTDPRAGWVRVDNDIEKKCDGTTMLYRRVYNYEITASPHHEECAG